MSKPRNTSTAPPGYCPPWSSTANRKAQTKDSPPSRVTVREPRGRAAFQRERMVREARSSQGEGSLHRLRRQQSAISSRPMPAGRPVRRPASSVRGKFSRMTPRDTPSAAGRISRQVRKLVAISWPKSRPTIWAKRARPFFSGSCGSTPRPGRPYRASNQLILPPPRPAGTHGPRPRSGSAPGRARAPRPGSAGSAPGCAPAGAGR